MKRIFKGEMKVNMARLAKHSQEFYSILSSVGVCSKAPFGLLYTLDDCAELYSSLKGMEMDPADLKKAGERIWNLLKIINAKEGFDRRDDQFPEKWLTPMKSESGSKALMDYFETKYLTAEDLQDFLNDYYDECGWGKDTGIPTIGKLEELGLTTILEAL